MKSGAVTHLSAKDFEGARMGMWLFLFTEVLLFGGLFLLYSVYRSEHVAEFHIASRELSKGFGLANTLILLTSSLTMALSIHAISTRRKKLASLFLITTILLGSLFLVNKYFEWSAKFAHGIYPNSPELVKHEGGVVLFYGLYYAMAGLHGLHVLAGVCVLIVMLFFLLKDIVNPEDYVKLENAGLYWHLVDIIWIFLFPLFYLIS